MTKFALLILSALTTGPFVGKQQVPAVATTGFEVASIHPGHGDKRASNVSTSPNMLTISNVPLLTIIAAAYGIADYQIAGPQWLKKERFDIVAKTEEPVASDDMLPLLQSLLAERFRLTLHRETRQLPAYVLTVAKGGAKMKTAETDADTLPFKKAMKNSGTRINAPRLTMAELASMLSRRMRHPVHDRTGLAGAYKVTLQWAADDSVQKPDKGKPAKSTAGDQDGPSIFTALQEQLGLKLEVQHKMPVEFFVIDHIEQTPTEN